MTRGIGLLVLLTTITMAPNAWADPISGQRTVATTANARVLMDMDSDADGPTTFTPPNQGGVGSSASAGGGGDGPPAVVAVVPAESGASASATSHSSGRFFLRSSLNSGDGGVGTTIQALQGPYGADLEASSTTFWKGIFVSSDTVNHRFGFHIENMSLSLTDNSGAYDLMNPLTAELGGEIRFGFGSGPLDPSDAIYRFTASLHAAGADSVFNLDVFNPTGAAVPNFSQFDSGNDHFASAPNFDAFVDLGLIPADQPFTLEYHAFTEATSPGIPSGEILSGEARFGDPFDVSANQPNAFQFDTQTTPIPEPSSLLVFAIMGGVLLGASSLRARRKTPDGTGH